MPRLPESVPVIALIELPDDSDLPVIQRVLGRDTPESVTRVAHEIADGGLAAAMRAPGVAVQDESALEFIRTDLA